MFWFWFGGKRNGRYSAGQKSGKNNPAIKTGLSGITHIDTQTLETEIHAEAEVVYMPVDQGVFQLQSTGFAELHAAAYAE